MCAIQNFSFPWMHPASAKQPDQSPRKDMLGYLNSENDYLMTVSDAKNTAKKHLRLL